MKNKKSGKSASKVKGEKEKRWKIFSKENLKWGVGSVVALSIVSLWLLSNPCEANNFPFPSICSSKVLFALLNWMGFVIISFFAPNNLKISAAQFLYKIAILVSTPFYYLIGIILRKVVNKIKK